MDLTPYQQIQFRRKFWKIVGASITMSANDAGPTIGFIKMKAWKLKEDISIYTDESLQQEVMRIRARSIIDFGATYDVVDSANQQPIISLQRKGLRSAFVRDYWKLLDANDTQVGYIKETSGGLAIARRYIEILPFGDIAGLIFTFVAQTYTIAYGPLGAEQVVGSVTHRKNPFIVKMTLDFSSAESAVDKRIGVAATSLLAIVDAVKNN